MHLINSIYFDSHAVRRRGRSSLQGWRPWNLSRLGIVAGRASGRDWRNQRQVIIQSGRIEVITRDWNLWNSKTLSTDFCVNQRKRQSLKWNWPSLKNKHRFESFRDLYFFCVAAFDERKKSMKELFAVKVASNSKTREKCISGRETRKFIVTRIRAASFVMNFDFWWFAKFVKSKKTEKFLFFCSQPKELAGRPDTAECSC